MVGDDFIDHQVRTIAEKFIETRSPEISQQHEFVFVRKHKFHQESASNELSHNKEILPVLLVIGQTSLNLIDLSKAVNRDKNKVIALDSIKVHKKLHRLLDVYKQIGLTNIHLQLEEMSTSPEQLLLVGL